jgi:hypothetical protein
VVVFGLRTRKCCRNAILMQVINGLVAYLCRSSGVEDLQGPSCRIRMTLFKVTDVTGPSVIQCFVGRCGSGKRNCLGSVMHRPDLWLFFLSCEHWN